MDHVSYELALARRDELLREAGRHRRATHVASATDASPNTPAGRKKLKLGRVSLARFVSQS